MNRANQLQLAHQTNLEVVAIRNFEINYYVTLYQTFGTQAAFIAGELCKVELSNFSVE